jgi:AraC-like DNA-binding protein
MSSSACWTFNDTDHFAAAVRAADVKIVATGRGSTHVELMRADLGALWLQAGVESFAHVAQISYSRDRAIMMFTHPGGAPIHWRGQQVPPGSLIGVGLGHDGYHYTDGPTHWATLSLPPVWAPPPAALRRLQALHRRVETLARETPWMLARVEPARALNQAIIAAVAACIGADMAKQEVVRPRRGSAIIARLDAMLEVAPDSPIYVPEVCAALGVSQRTLLTYCQLHVGVGPERYLRLRRMHMARRHLQEAMVGQGVVTRIATGLGFFELGRFAVAYRELFGESPSATLRRAPDDVRPPVAPRQVEKGRPDSANFA